MFQIFSQFYLTFGYVYSMLQLPLLDFFSSCQLCPTMWQGVLLHVLCEKFDITFMKIEACKNNNGSFLKISMKKQMRSTYEIASIMSENRKTTAFHDIGKRYTLFLFQFSYCSFFYHLNELSMKSDGKRLSALNCILEQ